MSEYYDQRMQDFDRAQTAYENQEQPNDEYEFYCDDCKGCTHWREDFGCLRDGGGLYNSFDYDGTEILECSYKCYGS